MVGYFCLQYANAEVYPHCVIENVLEPSYFSALREEMIANLSSTFKETDLFKLYQTGDLANLDPNDEELVCSVLRSIRMNSVLVSSPLLCVSPVRVFQASRLPNLIALRAAIYSPEFRSYLSQLAGCGPLSDRTDCSSNVYMHTCHLLCHDDVIGKRKGKPHTRQPFAAPLPPVDGCLLQFNNASQCRSSCT